MIGTKALGYHIIREILSINEIMIRTTSAGLSYHSWDTLYQCNHDQNHKRWDIISFVRYSLSMKSWSEPQALGYHIIREILSINVIMIRTTSAGLSYHSWDTLYQWNHDQNHKRWAVISFVRYSLSMKSWSEPQALGYHIIREILSINEIMIRTTSAGLSYHSWDTLYQWNHDQNHKRWAIISFVRYSLSMKSWSEPQALGYHIIREILSINEIMIRTTSAGLSYHSWDTLYQLNHDQNHKRWAIISFVRYSLSMKSWSEPQALGYHIIREILSINVIMIRTTSAGLSYHSWDTLYQWNHDQNHKRWAIISFVRYSLSM